MGTLASLILTFTLLIFQNAAWSKSETLAEVLKKPANPVDIDVKSSNLTVTQRINAAQGGRLSLKGSNGAEYTLTLAPHSLQYSMPITLKEIKEIKFKKDGSPVTGGIGVQIFPDGLELVVPASLEIKSSQAFNKKTFSALASHGDGSSAHIPMMKNLEGPSAVIQLFHFSNYAVTNDERVQEILDMGQATTDRIRIENYVSKNVNRLLDSNNAELWKTRFIEALMEIRDQVILPKLAAAKSCASGSDALDEYLNWAKKANVYNVDFIKVLGPTVVDQYVNVVQSTHQLCIDEAEHLCRVEHKVPEAVRLLNKVAKFAADQDAGQIDQAVEKVANSCLKFKFFMQIEYWVGEDRKNGQGFTAQSEFDFSYTLEGINLAAYFNTPDRGQHPEHDFKEGPVNIVDTSLSDEGFDCRRTSMTTRPGKVSVGNFIADFIAGRTQPRFYITPPENAFVKAKYRCVELNPDQGSPPEIRNVTLPPVGNQAFYEGLFTAMHGESGLKENVFMEEHYNLKNAVFKSSPKLVEANYDFRIEDEINEKSSFIIYHTPSDQ